MNTMKQIELTAAAIVENPTVAINPEILSDKPVFWQWHVWDNDIKKWFFYEDVVVETPNYTGCIDEAKRKLKELFPRFCIKYPERRGMSCVPCDDENIVIGKDMATVALKFENEGKEYGVCHSQSSDFIKIIRHEKYADGSFSSEVCYWNVRIENDKLFLKYGLYDNEAELNTSKGECLTGNCGVYFEVAEIS